MKTFSLEIAAERKSIPVLHRFIEESARELAIGADDVYDLKLALEEAVTNTISHGSSRKEGTIRIELSKVENTVVIHLWDEAKVFDPSAPSPTAFSGPLSERPAGGMGLSFLRASVDEISHEEREGGGNHLTLRKVLSRPSLPE